MSSRYSRSIFRWLTDMVPSLHKPIYDVTFTLMNNGTVAGHEVGFLGH